MTKTDNSLLASNELHQALTDFKFRNAVIENLDTTPGTDALFYERKTLALWLGSNVTLQDLARDGKVSDYLYIGYYLMLAFDKHISMFGEAQKKSLDILSRGQIKIFDYYNQNHHLLTTDPKKLFTEFRSIILDLDNGVDLSADEFENMRMFKRLCVIELSRVLSDHKISLQISRPTPELVEIDEEHNDKESMMETTTFTGIGLRLFFKEQINKNAETYPRACKIFLTAKDGTILEAIYYKKSQQPTQAVTIAMKAPFQAEFIHTSSSMAEFMKMFDTDVVFVNHRNYSVRSGRHAQSLDDVAGDIKVFADHFYNLGHDIKLYGMCGGAPGLILAAKQLLNQKVPYKLILDRTFDSYVDVFSLKNVIHFMNVHQASLPEELFTYYVLKLISLVGPYTETHTRSSLAKVDENLGEILMSLPEYDVMTLQGKSSDPQSPICEDKFISSDINIRGTIKNRRHQRKEMLKELSQLAKSIAQDFNDNPRMHAIFTSFEQCFVNGLRLIDDEKMRLNGKPARMLEYSPKGLLAGTAVMKLANERNLNLMDQPGRVRDIHAEWLFSLTARDMTPMR